MAAGMDAGLARHPAALSRLDAGAVLADAVHRRHGRSARRALLDAVPHGHPRVPAVPRAVAGAVDLPQRPGQRGLHLLHPGRRHDPLGAHAAVPARDAHADAQRARAGAQRRGHRRRGIIFAIWPGWHGAAGAAGAGALDRRCACRVPAARRVLRAVPRYRADRRQRHADRLLPDAGDLATGAAWRACRAAAVQPVLRAARDRARAAARDHAKRRTPGLPPWSTACCCAPCPGLFFVRARGRVAFWV